MNATDLEQQLTAQDCLEAMNGSNVNDKSSVNVFPDDDEGDENAKIFPQRLMEILTNPNNQDAIAWLPHGKAFLIVNRQKFADHVLPHYFRKTKYTSFTRKLNRWNFTRVTRGPELGAYYHEFFQRGNEALCTQMYCKNDRAKFAVAGKEGKKVEEPTVNAEEGSPQLVQSATNQVDPTRRLSVNEIFQLNTMISKPHMHTMNPSVQARVLLHGGMPTGGKDPMTNSIIESAMRALHQGNCSNLDAATAQHLLMQQAAQASPEAAFLRVHHLASMQQQPQNRHRALNFYRASAA